MKKRVIAILIVASIVISLSNVISVNAYPRTVSDEVLDKIANAKTVYLDKSFKVTYEKDESSDYYIIDKSSDSYYKIDIGNNKLVVLDVRYEICTSENEDDKSFYWSIDYLSEGGFEDAKSIDCLGRTIYILDKNKNYYLHCSTNVDVNVTLHNKVNDSAPLKKSNKGQITKNYEKIYSFKTTSKNNETIIKINYSGEGARLNCYAIGLDKNNNAFAYSAIGKTYWGTRSDSPWHEVLVKGKEHFILLETDNYTLPTDYTLSYISGAETKTVEKAKFKKKYTGSTFGHSDSYHYKLNPYKTKLKVQITGKNVEVNLNGKKVKCKKKVTKNVWVEPTGGGIFSAGTDLYVSVYKKGQKYSVFNEKGTDYSIKITKIKEKRHR